MKKLLFPLLSVLLIIFFLFSPSRNNKSSQEIYENNEGELLVPQRNVSIVVVDLARSGLSFTNREDIIKLKEFQEDLARQQGVTKVESILSASMVISLYDDIIVTRAIPEDNNDITANYLNELSRDLFDYPELTPYVNRDLSTLLFYSYYANSTPVHQIYTSLQDIQKKYDQNIFFEFTGRDPVIAETESLLTDDIVLFFPLLIIMVTAVFSLFRSIKTTGLSLLLIILSIGGAYSLVRYLGVSDTPLVLLIPVFSLGLLSDYLIHYFYHNYHTPHGNSSSALRRILIFPLSLTALSTLTGFLSLSLINGSGHIQLGVVIALAVVITWLGVFFWLSPRSVPENNKPMLPRFQSFQVKFFIRLVRFRYLFFLLAGLGVIWGGIKLFDLTIEPYPVEQLPLQSTIKKADNMVNGQFYGTIPFFIEIDTGEKNGILRKETMLELDKMQKSMAENRAGYTFSLLTVLKRMSYYWEGSEEILLTSDKYDDFYDALIEQYLLYYSSSVDPLEYESLLDNSYRFCSVKGLIYYKSYEDLDQFLSHVEEIREELPDSWSLKVYGMASQLEEEHDNLMNNWVFSFLLGSFLIFITVLIFYRKLYLALLSLVPSIVSMIISFGVISTAGISIDAFSIVFVAIITGLVIDYSIHTLAGLEHMGPVKTQEEGFSHIIGFSGIPIFLSFLTSLLSFSVLFFSSFRGARNLGFLLFTSLVLSFFLSLYLIPLIMLPFHVKKNQNTGDKNE
jgi:predicted RND superfamily exporter protein